MRKSRFVGQRKMLQAGLGSFMETQINHQMCREDMSMIANFSRRKINDEDTLCDVSGGMFL